MVRPLTSKTEKGFSLVELLVALAFTMVLMAGMANVYKASLSTFYTSGESLSSLRRNRMSVDLLVDDLNTSSMFLTDLSIPPMVSPTTPPFFILPNVDIVGASAAAGDPTQSDELYFYVDEALPFEGVLAGPASQKTASELVVEGTAPSPAQDQTFVIDCGNTSYANQVKAGQVFIFKDSWEAGYISAAPSVDGKTISVVAGASPNSRITGTGSLGLPTKAKHIPGCGIVFILPAQMVRYRIEMLNLDPTKPAGVPCLVRDQGTYRADDFRATRPQQIVAENVAGFKVYLSTNAGTSWAGLGAAYTGFANGWDQGIRREVDRQLTTSGRPDFKDTRASEHWFRSIPILVRADISTRTATQRAEYSETGNALAYKTLTQSLVFVPKHSGLTMN